MFEAVYAIGCSEGDSGRVSRRRLLHRDPVFLPLSSLSSSPSLLVSVERVMSELGGAEEGCRNSEEQRKEMAEMRREVDLDWEKWGEDFGSGSAHSLTHPQFTEGI